MYLKWYVVHTHPGCEKSVVAALNRQAFRTFLPFLLAESNVRPLFPTYLFVRFNKAKPWRTITYTDGVKRVLGAPTAVADKFVNSLIEACFVKNGTQLLYPGIVVQLNNSTSAIVQWSTPDRVGLLLSCLGREVICSFTKAEVEELI